MKTYTFIIQTNLGLETFKVEANDIYEAVNNVNLSFNGFIKFKYITNYKIKSHAVTAGRESLEDVLQ